MYTGELRYITSLWISKKDGRGVDCYYKNKQSKNQQNEKQENKVKQNEETIDEKSAKDKIDIKQYIGNCETRQY